MRFLALIVCFGMLVMPSVSQAEVFVGSKKSADEKESAETKKDAKKPSFSERWDGKKSELDKVDPKMKEFANNYFGNCMSKKHPILQGDNLKYLCACSAARIMKSMTPEQAAVMGTDTPEGLEQRNHMLLNVYVPCMKAPTESLLYQGCTNDPNTRKAIKNIKEVCGCTAKTMSVHIQEKAPEYIAESLRLNPFTTDPMAAFLSSPGYMQTAQTKLMECLQAHELKQ